MRWPTPRTCAPIVYLSTVGVYGDHAGAWVDETHAAATWLGAQPRSALPPSRPGNNFGARSGVPVAILRLAGIYGPGRMRSSQITRGNARRIVKPGQVFNRIHVADIAQAIDAALCTQDASGIFNVADDEPSPPGDPLAFAAQLLGRDAAAGNSIRRSRAGHVADGSEFLAGMPARAQRQAQARARRQLRYPTYREGLRALFAELCRPPPRSRRSPDRDARRASVQTRPFEEAVALAGFHAHLHGFAVADKS